MVLVGPGGVGKTRLALAVGDRLRADFADVVVWVDLAPIDDPALVLPAIARALGLREGGGMALADQLSAWLRARHLLLVLDNLEQVADVGTARSPRR